MEFAQLRDNVGLPPGPPSFLPPLFLSRPEYDRVISAHERAERSDTLRLRFVPPRLSSYAL